MADKKKGKQKEYTKGGLIQARVDAGDMSNIVNKALLYTKGNVSEFVRQAAINYRPMKKVLK